MFRLLSMGLRTISMNPVNNQTFATADLAGWEIKMLNILVLCDN